MNKAAQALNQSRSENHTLMGGLVASHHSKLLFLALTVFLSGFGVVYMKDVNRRYFVESQSLTKHANELETEWGQLMLEQSAWSTQSRIEKVATQKLNMQTPVQQSIVMVKP